MTHNYLTDKKRQNMKALNINQDLSRSFNTLNLKNEAITIIAHHLHSHHLHHSH